MANDRPLVLVILSFLTTIVVELWNLFCTIVWIIPLFCLEISDSMISRHPKTFFDSASTIIFRFPLSILGVGSILSEWFGILFIVWRYSRNDSFFSFISGICVCGSLMTLALISGSKKFNSRIVLSSHIELVTLVIVDFIVFLCGITSLLLLVRIHHFLRLANADYKTFRENCVLEIFRSIFDWLCLPFGLLLCSVGYWRLDSFTKSIINKTYLPSRIVLIVEALQSLIDLIALLFFVPVILTQYRCQYFWKEFVEESSLNAKRNKAFKYFFVISAELIAFFSCLLIVLPSYYRFSFVKAAISTDFNLRDPFKKSSLLFNQTCLVIYELPFWIMALLPLLSFYRSSSMLSKMKAVDLEKRPSIACKEACNVLIDLPFIILAVVGLLFFWRIPSTYKKFKKFPSAVERRKLSIKHLIKGIADIPAMFSFLLLCVTIYRVPILLKEIREQKILLEREKKLKRKQQEEKEEKEEAENDESDEFKVHLCIKDQVIELFKDIPCIFLFCFVLLFGFWRLPKLISSLLSKNEKNEISNKKNLSSSSTTTTSSTTATTATTKIDSKSEKIKDNIQTSIKPMVIETNRKKVIQAFFYVIFDYISFVCGIVVILTFFRAIPMIFSIKEKKKKINQEEEKEEEMSLIFIHFYHQIILKEFCLLFFDFIFIFIQLFSLWRFPFYVKDMISCERKRTEEEFKNSTEFVRRRVCLIHSLLAIGDIICIIAYIFLFLTQWQFRSLSKDIEETKKKKLACISSVNDIKNIENDLMIKNWLTYHILILRHFYYFLRDIPSILLLFAGCLTIWRIPQIIKQVKEMKSENWETNLNSSSTAATSALLDIVCSISFIILSLTWRSGNVIKILNNYSTATNKPPFQKPILFQMKQLFIDIPYICICPLSLWRFRSIIKSCFQPEKNAIQRRKQVLSSIKNVIFDLTSILLFSFCALFPWRTLSVFGKCLSSISESMKPAFTKAQVEVRSVNIFLPQNTDSHGISMIIRGTKPLDFTFTSATLFVEGKIWDCLEKVLGSMTVNAAKMALYPISLCPTYLDPTTGCQNDSLEFEIRIDLATGVRGGAKLSHQTLRTNINRIVNVENVDMTLQVCYSGAPSGSTFPTSGTLFRFVIKIRDLINNNTNFSFYPINLQQENSSSSSRELIIPEFNESEENEKNDNNCPFHKVALSTFIETLKYLPFELLALSTCFLPPFFNSATVLRELFGISDPTGRRRAINQNDFSSKKNQLLLISKMSLSDFIVFCMYCLIMLSIWRIPSLFKRSKRLWTGVYQSTINNNNNNNNNNEVNLLHKFFFRNRNNDSLSPKETFKEIIREEFFWLFIDMIFVLELSFIIFSLIELKSFIIRITNFMKFGAKQNSYLAKKGLTKFKRLWEFAKFYPENSFHNNKETINQREKLGDLGIPEELLTEIIIPRLDVKSLCRLSQTCSYFRTLTEADRYWKPLFMKKFANKTSQKNSTSSSQPFAIRSFKSLYAANHILSLGRPKPAEEIDYEQGIRYIVHSQTMSIFSNIHHVFLIPFKIIGLIMYPFYLLLHCRYNYFPLIPFEDTKREIMYTSHLILTKNIFYPNFMNIHGLCITCPLLYFAAIADHTAILISIFSVAFYFIFTLGCPFWIVLLQNNLSILTFLTGIVLPYFVILQIGILSAPTFLFWWRPETLVTIQYILSPISFLITSTSSNLIGIIISIVTFLISTSLWLFQSLLFPYFEPFIEISNWIGLSNIINFLLNISESFINITQNKSFIAHEITNSSIKLSELSLLSLFPVHNLDISLINQLLSVFLWPFEKIFHFEISILQFLATTTLNVAPLHFFFNLLLSIGSSRWFLQLIWIYVYSRSLKATFSELNRHFPGFNPLKLYSWPFIFTKILILQVYFYIKKFIRFIQNILSSILQMYSSILSISTRTCARLGFIGDLLLVPISIIWIFWPLHVPYRRSEFSLLFTAVPLCAYLCQWGTKVVKHNFVR